MTDGRRPDPRGGLAGGATRRRQRAARLARLLDWLRRRGRYGATVAEVMAGQSLLHMTATNDIKALAREGLAASTDRKRSLDGPGRQRVWVATEAKKEGAES